ncbi:hypothetical protein [Streptomyces boncukensis]|uniref:Uncharacterized protein n=1 Tax=Streptomyces boncukensis TaxID=2711219 RepID=A0A6G4X0G4_9ACTN|nr:hypothetical protein [Streptomyces boncukensis]NGO70878.1 hypothetical protein [Streptomyces boncukensis]
MWWWIKARRAHTLLPAALTVFALFALLVQDAVARLPSFLTGSDNPVVAMLLVPMPLCAALMMTLESRLTAAEDSATRRVRARDAGLTLTAVGAAALVGFVLGAALDSDTALAVGRNTAFLTGLMLCVRAAAGAPAVMAPVVWFLAVALFGFDRANHPYFWTVLPRDFGDPAAALAAAVALAAGLTAQLGLRPRTDSGS